MLEFPDGAAGTTGDPVFRVSGSDVILNDTGNGLIWQLKGRTFGDNDWLSFLIAKLVKADTLILLTTVDGLLDAAGRRIPRVESFRNVARLVRAGEKGRLSKGGMDSKLKAVKAAVEAGIDVYVANGRKTVLAPILAGRNVATFFPGSAL